MHPARDPAVTEMLQAFTATAEKNYSLFVGFPVAIDFDYQELYPLLRYPLNNVGDPFAEAPLYALHSDHIEREVITFFADVFRAPADDRWGYVTNGGTEGNLYALYVARERQPEATVFYTDTAHYSIAKNTYLLRQKTCVVATRPSGEMDYDDLARQLQAYRGKPVIIVATVGTTMTEARDDVARIREAAAAAGVARAFVHVDAALTGLCAALLRPRHRFDFADGADSISVSGHKFIGSPIPCGVVLVRASDREGVRRPTPYTGTPDITISGSRNGHTPIILWYAIRRWGVAGFKKRAEDSRALADYTHQALQRIGWEAWRNPQAITVVLRTPPDDTVRKWQLATYDGWSHIICMPGMTTGRIDRFITDLAAAKPLVQ